MTDPTAREPRQPFILALVESVRHEPCSPAESMLAEAVEALHGQVAQLRRDVDALTAPAAEPREPKCGCIDCDRPRDPGFAYCVPCKNALRFGPCLACLHDVDKRAAPAAEPDDCPDYGPGRCEVCDWPLKERMEDGCVAGNCARRPGEHTDDYRRIRERRAALARKAAKAAEPDGPRVEQTIDACAAKAAAHATAHPKAPSAEPVPEYSARPRCGHCPHAAHIGPCLARNGGTAYQCPCNHDTAPSPSPAAPPPALAGERERLGRELWEDFYGARTEWPQSAREKFCAMAERIYREGHAAGVEAVREGRENSQLVADRDRLAAEVERMQETIDGLRSGAANARDAIRTKEREHLDVCAESDEANASLRRMVKERDTARADRDRLASELSRMQYATRDVRTMLTDARSENAALRAHIVDLEEPKP